MHFMAAKKSIKRSDYYIFHAILEGSEFLQQLHSKLGMQKEYYIF